MSFTGTPAQDLLTGLPPDVEDGGYVPEIGEEEIESEKGDDTESEEPEEDEDEDYISFLSSIVLSHVLEEEKEIMLDVSSSSYVLPHFLFIRILDTYSFDRYLRLMSSRTWLIPTKYHVRTKR